MAIMFDVYMYLQTKVWQYKFFICSFFIKDEYNNTNWLNCVLNSFRGQNIINWSPVHDATLA